MGWWIWLWTGILALLTLAGAWDDHNDGRGLFTVLTGIASGAVAIFGVFAYYQPPLAQFIGRGLLPLVVLAALQLVFEGIRDVQSVRTDPVLTEAENRTSVLIGVAVVFTLFGIALTLGFLAGIRQ